MKINQLFNRELDPIILQDVILCFGLTGLADRRFFSKDDMIRINTVHKLRDLVPTLETYYLPCKARVYLVNISEKKAITVFKQILKLFAHTLLSRERNTCHRKVIQYQIISFAEREALQKAVDVCRHEQSVRIEFD